MRQVLEHAFFTGGNLPSNRDSMDQTSPQSTSSSVSKNSRSTTTRSKDPNVGGRPGQSQVRSHGMDTPEVKTVNSTESNENRKKRSSKSSKRQSGAAALTIAPLDRDGVLAVAGAKLRSSLRRHNI
jgi:hypothetical protein